MKQAKFNVEKRKDKDGEPVTKNVPIRLSMFVNGKRLEYYTGYRISNTKNFNTDYSKTGKPFVKSNEPDAGRLNRNLKAMKEKAESYYDAAIHSSQTPTCESIREQLDEYYKKKDVNHDQILVKDAFAEFMDSAKKENKSHKTLQKYTTLLKHLSNAFGKEFNKLTFDKIDTAFVERFKKSFIKNGYKEADEQKAYKHNTVVKYLRSFSEFLNWCKAKQRNYYSGDAEFGNLQEEEINVIYLTPEEIEQVEKAELPNQRLQEVKDIFLFGCYTGMRYQNIFNLKKSDIKGDRLVFYIAKGKHTTWHTIPIVSKAKIILEKYQELSGNKALPVLSNPKMNLYIKDVMKQAGINEMLTIREVLADGTIQEKEYQKWELIGCHNSRKTFISYAVNHGIEENVIKSITAHSKNSRAFTKYYEIREEKKQKAMEALFPENPSLNLKAV